MTLTRLPQGISRSLERLIMAPHAADVLVVPILLSEVRAVKQEDGGDIGVRDEVAEEMVADVVLNRIEG